MIITIDGPAGAGKTTIAKLVAKRLGAYHIDSGAMYRAVALAALDKGVDPSDSRKVAELLSKIEIVYIPLPSGFELFLNGEEVSKRLRLAEVTAGSSAVAVHPQVRRYMVSIQRELGRKYDLVMEGRDIGSFVFPDADFRFYLDAGIEERARRRLMQYNIKPTTKSLASTIDDIQERDRRDSSRHIAPLVIPRGARIIDSTDLSIEEVVDEILKAVKGR